MTTTAARAGDGYDRVARATHWLLAALAVNVVTFGWASEGAARGSQARDDLLLVHRSLGLTILVLVVFRILWRLRHPPSRLPATVPRIQRSLAVLAQSGLDAVFLAMPLAGYANAAVAGHAVSLFGLVSIPPLLSLDARVSQLAIAVHLVGQYFVYFLVVLHVAGALYHGIVRRDGVLERMLPRRLGPQAKTRSA